MTRHGRPTFVLAAALLVVVAGMVVMIPAAGGLPFGVDRLGGVDGHQAGESVASFAPASGGTAIADQKGLHEELSTYAPTSTGPSVSRQVEGEHEDDPDSEQRLHRWRCPICDATKLSFGTPGVDPVADAANNLRSHIRNSDGGGHGPLGTVPGWITARDIVEDVSVLALAD